MTFQEVHTHRRKEDESKHHMHGVTQESTLEQQRFRNNVLSEKEWRLYMEVHKRGNY